MHRHRNPFRQKGSGRENEFFEAIATMREGERYECPTTGAPPNDIGHAPPRRHDQQHDDNRPSHPDGADPLPRARSRGAPTRSSSHFEPTRVPRRRPPTPNPAANTPRTRRRPDSTASSPRPQTRPATAGTTKDRSSRPDDAENAADTRHRSLPAIEAALEWLKSRFRRGLDAVRSRGDELNDRLRDWVNSLLGEVTHGGVGLQAAFAGVQAALKGKNPVWGAVKGLVSGLSPKAEIGLVLLLALALVLGPVLLVILLLALLVAAVIAAIRSATE